MMMMMMMPKAPAAPLYDLEEFLRPFGSLVVWCPPPWTQESVGKTARQRLRNDLTSC